MRLDFDNFTFVTSLLASMMLGMGFSAVYDIIRAIKSVYKPPKVVTFFIDWMLLSLLSVMTFTLILVCTKGAIRIYYYIGIILGFILQRLTFSFIIYNFFKWLFSNIRKFFAVFGKALTDIIERIHQVIGTFCKKLSKKVKKIIKNTCKRENSCV